MHNMYTCKLLRTYCKKTRFVCAHMYEPSVFNERTLVCNSIKLNLMKIFNGTPLNWYISGFLDRVDSGNISRGLFNGPIPGIFYVESREFVS